MKTVKPILVLSVWLVAAQGLATTAQAKDGAVSGHVMFGAAFVPDYEGSQDYTAAPVAAAKVEYEGYYVETRGLGLRANLSPNRAFEIGPAISFNGGRDDDVDNARVARMREIDSTVEAGMFLKIPFGGLLSETDQLAFNFDFLADTGDSHEGYTIGFGPSYGFAVSERLRLGANLSATYASDDYTQTFFGVDADNASRSGLARYDAEGGIKDVGIGVNAMYSLTRSWGITGMARYTQLIGDAADSPLVDQEGSAGQAMVSLGVLYRF